jgi:hypothetical protein
MPLIETLVLTLGPAIGNTLLKSWLGEGPIVNLTDNLVDLLTGLGADKARQRKIERQLETIGQQVADEMRPFFEREARSLSQEDRIAVIHELAATLSQARITPHVLARSNLDPQLLVERLRSARPDATLHKSDAERTVYERMLGETSAALVRLAPQIDGFLGSAFAETLQDLDRILEAVSELLKRPDEAAEQFEREYRDAVSKHLNRMDYFGVPHVDAIVGQQQLSAAYVTLQFERRAKEHDKRWFTPLESAQQVALDIQEIANELVTGESRSTQSGPIDLLLSEGRRLVIVGEAGGGKSTLLRWLAVSAASRDFPPQLASWNDSVPFFIRLRECADKEFPALKDFPMMTTRNLTQEPPSGWLLRQLNTGRALVLLDGVDELPQGKRDAMLAQLDQLVQQYPLARYVVTSRPAALKPDEWPEWAAWIKRAALTEASLQPLDMPQIDHLIDKWHEALGATISDAGEVSQLQPLPARLKSQLRQRPALGRLATNPLLCSMLCALHQERRAALPAERVKLYDECIKMLLERRDIRRGVQHSADYPSMSYDHKLALLKDLALWLMRSGSSDAECEEVDARFERELPNLSVETTGERVRAFFVERGSLLREPVEGRIDFAHRTFQEFLAAQGALEDTRVGELLNYARDDQWRETIVLAAGKAYPKDCEQLLRGLIEQGNTQEQRVDRHRYHLLAIACLETAVKVAPETRQYVLDQAAAIFPPRDMDEARLVAAAGDPAVPFLRHNLLHNWSQAAACVRALASIGSDAALQTIADYASQPEYQVQLEIGRAWTAFDRVEYARHALAGSVRLVLPFSPSAEHIQLVTHVSNLMLTEASEPVDLTLLASLPHLAQLTLYSLSQLSNLAPLAQLHNLAQLELSGLDQLSNLAPLAQLHNLAQLELSGLDQLSDLAPLAQLHNLAQLTLYSLPQLSDLAPLAQLHNLAQLELSGLDQLSDLAPLAQLPALAQLTLSGLGQLSDLSPLAQLPHLAQLELRSLFQLSDLTPLASLPSLRELHIIATGVNDYSPLEGLPNLNVNGRPVAELLHKS